MNRAQRRAAKSKRGGKQYMESSKQVGNKNTKAFAKKSLRKSMRNSGATFKAYHQGGKEQE
jgi:hypothetical protein